MKIFEIIKNIDKKLASSFFLALIFGICIGVYLDKPHIEDTQVILNNTNTIPEDSKKLDLILNQDINEMLESEGSSLDEVRIIKEDSNRISNMYFDDGIKNVYNESYEDAYSDFNKSLMFGKNSSILYSNMAASILKDKGSEGVDEALEYMDIAYNIDPESSTINYNYGYILFKKSVYDVNATNYLQNATKLDPEDKLAWKYLALSSYYTQNYVISKDAAEKALEKMPDDKLMWSILTSVSQIIDDSDKQLEAYDLVIAKCPQCPDIDKLWFNKAVIYAQKGEYEEMLDSFNNSIRINPVMRKTMLEIYPNLVGAIDVKETTNLNSANDVIVIKSVNETIPSLVYNETIIDNKIKSVNVVFFVTDKQANYVLTVSDSEQLTPPYRKEESKEMKYEDKPMKLLWYYIEQMKNLN